MQYYGLTQALSQIGYYETEHHQQLIKDTFASEGTLNGSRVSTRLVAIQNNGATLTSDQRGGQQGGQSLYRDWIAYVWPVSADGSQFAKADVVLAHHQDRDLAIQ